MTYKELESEIQKHLNTHGWVKDCYGEEALCREVIKRSKLHDKLSLQPGAESNHSYELFAKVIGSYFWIGSFTHDNKICLRFLDKYGDKEVIFALLDIAKDSFSKSV